MRARPGAKGALTALALFAGCADLLGLDLGGWERAAPVAGAAGAPPLEAPGGAGQGGAGQGGAGPGDAGPGGAGSAGFTQNAACADLPDRRDDSGACCRLDSACDEASGPLACAPAAWAERVPYAFAEDVAACPEAAEGDAGRSDAEGGARPRAAGRGGDGGQGSGPPSGCLRTRVELRMRAWNHAAYYVGFAPRRGESRFLSVRAKRGACYYDASNPDAPALWLDPDGASGCDDGAIAHVLGHALGLPHAHQRADRDRYLRLDPGLPCGCADEVQAACAPDAGPGGPFDYGSVMMYGAAPAAPPFFTDRAGHALAPPPTGPSPLDASAVLERVAAKAGWQPSAVIGNDDDPKAPVRAGLPGGATLHRDYAPAVALEQAAPPALAGRLHLVVVSREFRLFEKSADAPWSSGPAPRPRFSASPWADLGLAEVNAAPALASPAPGRLDIVARTGSGVLFHRALGEPGWAGLTTPPGTTSVNAFALAAWGPGRLALVAITRPGNEVWLMAYEGGAWGPWQSLALTGGTTIALASRGPGKLDVFVRAPDGVIVHRRRDPDDWLCSSFEDAWCPTWEPLPGEPPNAPFVTGGPAVAASNGSLDLFLHHPTGGAGNDGHEFLWHRRYERGEWSPWRMLGGLYLTPPGAVAWSETMTTVYGVGLASPYGDGAEEREPVLLERTWHEP